MGDIQKILEYAVWAPSGDNSQPWEFEIEENILHIWNLPDRDNPFLNYEQSGSYIAHGALIENIIIASTHFGYTANLSLFPEDSQPNKVATIVFNSASETKPDPLFDFIRQRHTNRRPYLNDKLTIEQAERLRLSVADLASVYFVDDKQKKQVLGEAGAEAEVVILENRQLHKYLFKDVVWSARQEAKHHQGLYIESMEFNPIQKILFKLASFWFFMRFAIVLGLPRFIARQDSLLYSSGAVLGLITMPNESRNSAISAGRAMQRLWLTASSMDLSFHPVSATLFFGRRIIRKDADMLSLKHKDLMLRAYERIRHTFGIKDNEVPYMMCRIGKAKPVSARTSRHDVGIKIKNL